LAQFGCGGSGASATPPPATFKASNVFVVVLENHGYSSVIGNPVMPYLNSLASSNTLATNYFANTHPSIGNYFMLTTGTIPTTDDAFAGTISSDNIVRELTAAGKTWKGYFESLPSVGYTGGDILPYVKHHNPFAYFSDVLDNPAQQANLVPTEQLAQDIASGRLPQFGFIVPNNYANAHDCTPGVTCTDDVKLSAADTWLQNNIDPLVKSAAFQNGGLLFIVFDEAELTDTANGGGRVPVVIVSPGAKSAFQSGAFYQHQNLLRTLLEQLGVTAFPGAAASAAPMSDIFK
jgi:acid phosphatase